MSSYTYSSWFDSSAVKTGLSLFFPPDFDLGILSVSALKYLTYVYENTVCEMWRPHLVIYLDAPIKFVRTMINKRNVVSTLPPPLLTPHPSFVWFWLERNKQNKSWWSGNRGSIVPLALKILHICVWRWSGQRFSLCHSSAGGLCSTSRGPRFSPGSTLVHFVQKFAST